MRFAHNDDDEEEEEDDEDDDDDEPCSLVSVTTFISHPFPWRSTVFHRFVNVLKSSVCSRLDKILEFKNAPSQRFVYTQEYTQTNTCVLNGLKPSILVSD